MDLIKYENYQIIPTEEAFMVKPIRDLYNGDNSLHKEKFMQSISYVYFMVDPRSSYADIIDYNEREREVIKQEGLPPNFKPDKKLKEIIKLYKELTTTTSTKLLNSMRIAIDKIGSFLENVSLTELDDKGRPIYGVDRIASTVDKIPGLVAKFMDTEKLVASEIIDKGRARGGNESKKLFEDGIPD